MKAQIVWVVCLLVVSTHAISQKERFYLFNDVWQSVKNPTEAAYFLVIQKVTDTAFACKYYRISGSMIKTETFTNEDCTQPGGFFAWYNEEGYADSAGFISGKQKVGTWQHFDKGKLTNKIEYLNGRPWRTTNFIKDSIYYADSTAEKYVRPTNFTDAQYQGGYTRYRADLQRNLTMPERGSMLKMKGTIMVQFTVDETGRASGYFLLKSLEWSVDEAGVFAISKANKWLPATLNGRAITSNHQQTINFQFQ
jgi:hypothetical protein